MRKSFEDNITVVLYILLVYTVVATGIESLSNPWRAVYAGIAAIVLITLNEVFALSNDKSRLAALALITAGSLAAFTGSLFNYSSTYCIYYFVLMYQLMMHFRGSLPLLFTVFFYALNISSLVITYGASNQYVIFQQGIYSLLYFAAAYIFTVLLRQIIRLNRELDQSRNNYSISNIKLINTNSELLRANEKVEEMAVLRERNNISREMHDILGHTLTTALVEVEAAKANMDKNSALAMEKLNISSDQIRRGLQEVRDTVRALKNDNRIDYYREMLNLIENISLNHDIVVRCDIDDVSEEKYELLRVIYRCLQEGLTNGIRHGGATAFLFKLKYAGNNILFSLEDNGKGCPGLNKGFGLNSMEERVSEVDGEISFQWDVDEGFNINIKFKR